MGEEQEDVRKRMDELQEHLKKKVDEIIAEWQSDLGLMNSLRGGFSKHIRDGVYDDVFDEVKEALVQIVRNGEPLSDHSDAYDKIGEIAWEVVPFLDGISEPRSQLNRIIRRKCEELVKGDCVNAVANKAPKANT